MKTYQNNRLAQLKGRTWNGEPAPEHLWTRLMGEDGEPAWTLEEACKLVGKRLRTKISPQMLSKWLKQQNADRRAKENFELVQKTTLEFLAENSESTLNIEKLVDVQMVLMIGRIHSEDGAEEAVKAMNALTKLKQVGLAEKQLGQRAREYEESVEKLKARIDELCKILKKQGGTAEQIDAFNRAAVEAVDKTILRG